MPRISAKEFEAIARDAVPMIGQMGVTVEEIGEGTARARVPYQVTFLRPGGTIAGPVLMALADFAMYGAVLSRIGMVPLAVTTNLNINFLRRPKPGDLVAEAKLQKLGRRLAFGEVAMYIDDDPDMVAHVTLTYSIPPNKEAESE